MEKWVLEAAAKHMNGSMPFQGGIGTRRRIYNRTALNSRENSSLSASHPSTHSLGNQKKSKDWENSGLNDENSGLNDVLRSVLIIRAQLPKFPDHGSYYETYTQISLHIPLKGGSQEALQNQLLGVLGTRWLNGKTSTRTPELGKPGVNLIPIYHRLH